MVTDDVIVTSSLSAAMAAQNLELTAACDNGVQQDNRLSEVCIQADFLGSWE